MNEVGEVTRGETEGLSGRDGEPTRLLLLSLRLCKTLLGRKKQGGDATGWMIVGSSPVWLQSPGL